MNTFSRQVIIVDACRLQTDFPPLVSRLLYFKALQATEFIFCVNLIAMQVFHVYVHAARVHFAHLFTMIDFRWAQQTKREISLKAELFFLSAVIDQEPATGTTRRDTKRATQC